MGPSLRMYPACQSSGLQIFPLARDNLGLLSAGNRLHPQRRIAIAVGDERDLRSIRRPPRIHVVQSAIRDRKRTPTRRWHHPQLMPTLPHVGRIDHALSVRRKVRTSLPVGFFVINFALFGARLRLDLPESTRAVNMSAIRDEQNFRAIPRPYRIDLVIRVAVVIARQRTDVLPGKLLYVAE